MKTFAMWIFCLTFPKFDLLSNASILQLKFDLIWPIKHPGFICASSFYTYLLGISRQISVLIYIADIFYKI
jgi:hypothetical protein